MKQFGPKEISVISRLSYEKAAIVTKERLVKLFGGTALVRQIIYQLKKKGVLKSITIGVYYYSPLESGPATENPFVGRECQAGMLDLL